jgi:hypothetical protein
MGHGNLEENRGFRRGGDIPYPVQVAETGCNLKELSQQPTTFYLLGSHNYIENMKLYLEKAAKHQL